MRLCGVDLAVVIQDVGASGGGETPACTDSAPPIPRCTSFSTPKGTSGATAEDFVLLSLRVCFLLRATLKPPYRGYSGLLRSSADPPAHETRKHFHRGKTELPENGGHVHTLVGALRSSTRPLHRGGPRGNPLVRRGADFHCTQPLYYDT